MEMDLTTRLIFMALLILSSAYFSIAEISLAASSRIKMHQFLEQGIKKAQKVIDLQIKPGPFFSVIQIGVNAIAILGGIVGETVFSPFFEKIFLYFLEPEIASSLSFFCSFFIVTMIFVLFADLIPKRIGLNNPEKYALLLINSMMLLILLLKPFVICLTGLSNFFLKLMGIPTKNESTITSEDILATVGAGAEAGLLDNDEKQAIENVIKLEDRLVTSAMTPRESVSFFKLGDSLEVIKKIIEENPHSKYLVCDKSIDRVIGYVDAKDLLCRALENEKLSLHDKSLLNSIPSLPDTLSLSEALEVFKNSGKDIAVILNEYALTVGIITLRDVMSTVMGNLVQTEEDSYIVQRSTDSWLIDGATPIEEVERAFELEKLPDDESYETAAGFMMYMLRKIPKLTDYVIYKGYKFEVIDVDMNRIDQILVTKLADSSDENNKNVETTPASN